MPHDRQRTREEIYEDVLSRLEGVHDHGEYATAFCPTHENTSSPALSILKREDGVSFKDHAEDCSTEEICEAIGIEPKDLFTDAPQAKVVRLRSRHKKADENEKPGELGCTVEDYASAKGLPADWLKNRFGLRDLTRHPKTGAAAMVIPYFNADEEEARIRYRLALEKAKEGPDPRFSWKTGSKADLLYGLEDLAKICEQGSVVLVEGESDRHTLVYHEFPALGVPGAGNVAKAVNPEDFTGLATIYAVVELADPNKKNEKARESSGKAGEKFGEKLGEIFGDRLRLVTLGEHDDPSGLHLACLGNPDKFKERFGAALSEATPYTEKQQQEQEKIAANLWEECKDLAESENVLAEFERDVKRMGVVGQEREMKVLYLASTTRFLETPSSVVIKGPSSGGKSFTLNKVLEFQPEESYYKLTAMSDKALAHFDKPLKHKHLVIAEAAALDNSEMATYLTRTLLSEGYLQYIYPLPAPDGGMDLHEVYVEGPTGLFITTTQQSLHQENETRLLSITVNDTKIQTRSVVRGIADKKKKELNTRRWHALQEWINMVGNKEVTIPYAIWIAESIPDEALHVRLRRDFTQVLNLIEAHALLHQVNRGVDGDGLVVANCHDYRQVHGLLCDIIAEGLEASIAPTVRQTVEVLRSLYNDLEDKSGGVSVASIKNALDLDRSAAYRRIQTVLRRGFVKNLEDRKGKPARYVPDDPLPDDVLVLPEPDELVASGMCGCANCSAKSEGQPNTPSFAARPEGADEEEREIAEQEAIDVFVPSLPPYPPEPGAGYVYLVEVGRYYKIGWTKKLKKRVGELNGSVPFPLRFVDAVPTVAAYRVEQRLHRKYAEFRAKGEWFKLKPEHVEEIRRHRFLVPNGVVSDPSISAELLAHLHTSEDVNEDEDPEGSVIL